VPVVAAAVCPHPPLLVPEIAAGAASETEDLRAACDTAVNRLVSTAPDALVLIGAGSATVDSFAAYGAPDVKVDADTPAPLSLLIGAWLVQRNGTDLPRSSVTVAGDAPPAECLDVGRRLASAPERLALLVMGDGSARRSEHSPGHLHPRAEVFDTTVAAALGSADVDVLAALDPYIAAEVAAAGRAAWQVLAGAAAGRDWRADLLYDAAPYGLGYFVSTWL
jgi:hypothetical protein